MKFTTNSLNNLNSFVSTIPSLLDLSGKLSFNLDILICPHIWFACTRQLPDLCDTAAGDSAFLVDKSNQSYPVVPYIPYGRTKKSSLYIFIPLNSLKFVRFVTKFL